ncbi:hypothetical protein PV373_08735 [Streptomyces sp. ME02-7008A]|uniref:hypothetical protein n=1 Tax=unclassified Streptomyces TaxID=2593676 RepID=UPI0029B33CCB|nr:MULTISPECIES: hypothetical protein [unclassified Streptomyces]MDX3302068.1 hypothetical protein [Streptomyces sp. ME02-7008A]
MPTAAPAPALPPASGHTPRTPAAPAAPVASAPVARPFRSPVVSLAPARSVPAAALPVQRAPEAQAARPSQPPIAPPPPVRTPAPAPAPARVTSPPRATSVAVQRSSSGSSAADKPAPSVTSQLKPRDLKEDQVAELVHRLIGPMTRMLRAELRLDRERIGKLRDPRH